MGSLDVHADRARAPEPNDLSGWPPQTHALHAFEDSHSLHSPRALRDGGARLHHAAARGAMLRGRAAPLQAVRVLLHHRLDGAAG